MFSNPIKRLGESLAQAQEQARQQRLRHQRPQETKALFEGDSEEALFVNGDEHKLRKESEENATKSTEELPSTSDSKDTTLPKDVRIKLVKLAKYEDKHPKLQAAYRESQAKIANFEKVLRERTPLGSITEIEDFSNYLNTLSARTDMSIEELKRVTGAHDALQKEIESLREIRRHETEDLMEKVNSLENERSEQNYALQKANETENAHKEETETLRKQLGELECALADAKSERELLENLQQEKGTMLDSLGTLQRKLANALEETKVVKEVLQAEKSAFEKETSELRVRNRELEVELAAIRKAGTESLTSASVEALVTAPAAVELSTTDLERGAPSSSTKKKKKKKKKTVNAMSGIPPASPLPGVRDNASEVGLGQSFKESIAELDAEVEATAQELQKQVTSLTTEVVTLENQAAESASTVRALQDQLVAAEEELQIARSNEERLRRKNEDLVANSEEVEELRDMLRDVGNELVAAKGRIREIEAEKAELQTGRGELEATIAKLTQELSNVKAKARSLEDVQSRFQLTESLAETRLSELNEIKDKCSTVESEMVKVKAELATVSADRNDLTGKLGDAQTKLRQLDRSEKTARDAAGTAQAALSTKEAEVTKLRAEFNGLQNTKTTLEESLRMTKQTLSKLEVERNQAHEREMLAREEVKRSQREKDIYREKITALESLRTNLTSERDSLNEELGIKTAQLESVKTHMQNLREQTSEMGHRAREATERCEALQEELSEAYKLLSERAREAGTLHQLLDEAEGREAGRIKEATDKMERAIEEREAIEEEIMLLRKSNEAGSGQLTKSLRDKESLVKDLTDKCKLAEKDLGELKRKNRDAEIEVQRARKDAEEAASRMSKLLMSLEETTTRAQQLQQERNSLKEAAEESQIRIDQLQRTQRHLSEELKRLKGMENRNTAANLSQDSRRSLTDLRSSTADDPRRSISSLAPEPPNRGAIDREYLRNVLVQFFEHKDKRAQLLPVLSMLLNFSKADETKLLR